MARRLCESAPWGWSTPSSRPTPPTCSTRRRRPRWSRKSVFLSKISPTVDCGDQEGFRLRHRYWRRVPETYGDPQHDLLAQVHRWPGELFRLIPWWAPISHFEFRRRWLRWWPPWLILTWPRTLTMPGTNSSRSYLKNLTVIFFSAEAMDRLLQCATHALPYFSASVSFFFMISRILNIWGPEKYWLLAKVPSTAFAEYLISKVLPHYYLLSEIPGTDTKYISLRHCLIHFLSKLKIPPLTAQDRALQADRRDVSAPRQVEQPWGSC